MQKPPGRSDILVGKLKPAQAIRTIPGSLLSVLASGTHTPSPYELMAGQALKGFLESRATYHWIVIDGPPVAPVTEPWILASLCDGVVIVAGAEMISRRTILLAIERLTETGARLLGVALKRAQIEKHSYY